MHKFEKKMRFWLFPDILNNGYISISRCKCHIKQYAMKFPSLSYRFYFLLKKTPVTKDQPAKMIQQFDFRLKKDTKRTKYIVQ